MSPLGCGAMLLTILLAAPSRAATHAIDGKSSTLTIHVGKSGVFSAFGDTHTIKAPIASGSVKTPPEAAVEVTVEARQLKVLDPELAPGKREEVQTRTLGAEVLDVERYPEIRFHSTKVVEQGSGRWRVEGDLEMHGKKVPIAFDVTVAEGRVRGSATLSQRAFGIEPIKVAGGTVKVKDEVSVDLDVSVPGSEASPSR